MSTKDQLQQETKHEPQLGTDTAQATWGNIGTDRRMRLAAVPMALSFGFVLETFDDLRPLSWYPSMLVHEFGHAVTAWLGGMMAFPTPFGVTFSGGDRIWAVAILLTAVLSAALALAIVSKLPGLAAFLACLLIAHIKLAYLGSAESRTAAVTAGGCAGELWISAALIAAFYHRFPDRWRWDFWRLPALLLGSVVFARSFGTWWNTSRGRGMLPFGSVLGGDGDMEHLLLKSHWPLAYVLAFYRVLLNLCITLIVIHYLIGVLPGGRHQRHVRRTQRQRA